MGFRSKYSFFLLKLYLFPGVVGLNNIKANDYLNVILKVGVSFDYFQLCCHQSYFQTIFLDIFYTNFFL